MYLNMMIRMIATTTTTRIRVILVFFHHIFLRTCRQEKNYQRWTKLAATKKTAWSDFAHLLWSLSKSDGILFEGSSFVDEVIELLASLHDALDILRHDASYFIHLTQEQYSGFYLVAFVQQKILESWYSWKLEINEGWWLVMSYVNNDPCNAFYTNMKHCQRNFSLTMDFC